MLRKILAASSLVLVAPVAFSAPPAAKKGAPKKAAPPAAESASGSSDALPAYGMAGCGIGAMVIDRNEMLPQIGAFVLNNWIVPQTSAITSGTSNCSEAPREVAQVEQEVFIAANLNTITKEAAQGSGERMDALAEVLGCSEEGTEALRQLCKDKHESIFNSNDSKMVLSTLREEIKANENVASNCDRA